MSHDAEVSRRRGPLRFLKPSDGVAPVPRAVAPLVARTIMMPTIGTYSGISTLMPVSVAALPGDVAAMAAAAEPPDDIGVVVTPVARITKIGARRIIDWRGVAAADPSLPPPGRSALDRKRAGAPA